MKQLFILSILLLICGCSGKIAVIASPEAGSRTIPLVELSMPGRLEQYSADRHTLFSADQGFAGELPIPLDMMMELLQKQDPAPGKFTVAATGDNGIVSQWNHYAACAIFSGREFDRRAERISFLQRRFGNAAGEMQEYFRIWERRMITLGALCGIGYPSYPTARMICEDDLFGILAACLERAAAKADTDSARQAVRDEQQKLENCRRELTAAVIQIWQQTIANSGRSTAFVTHYGDAPDIQTTLLLEADENGFSMILTAEEPAMGNRNSQPRVRDYADLWAEDGFEIFIVTDPDNTASCLQFIINSHGALWDATCDIYGRRDPGWSAANAKVQFSELDQAWQVKFTIPWQDLGFSGIPDKKFLVNVYRNRRVRGVPAAIYAWAPVGSGAFFQPEYFGYFIWKDNK